MRRAGHSWVAGGRIYQPIAWDEPRATEDNEVPETYVVRYKKTIPATGTDNISKTTETSLILSLPLLQQVVTYIVSVAGKAGTERGNFSDELTLQYSSMYVCTYLGMLIDICIFFPCFNYSIETYLY